MSGLRQRKSIIATDESSQKPILKRIAAADLFPKPKEDYSRVQTSRGAFVSLITILVIASFVLWEVIAYIIGRDAYKTELGVDTSLSKEVWFNIDITFPEVPCHELSLDVLDVTGTFKLNVTQSMYMNPIHSVGDNKFRGNKKFLKKSDNSIYDAKKDPESSEYCGECFIDDKYKHLIKTQKVCCNSCEDVLKMYESHGIPKPNNNKIQQCNYELSVSNPGCNCRGQLKVRKINGMLLFAPKRVGNAFRIRDAMRFNSSHFINKFSIGDERVTRFSRRGVNYPLNGHNFVTKRGLAEVRYFLKIVPTAYFISKGKDISGSSYEYGVQWSHRQIPINFGKLPSVAFGFEFTPIQVNNYFVRPSFYHFLVQLCAIVGGLFVVLGLIDGFVLWVGKFF